MRLASGRLSLVPYILFTSSDRLLLGMRNLITRFGHPTSCSAQLSSSLGAVLKERKGFFAEDMAVLPNPREVCNFQLSPAWHSHLPQTLRLDLLGQKSPRGRAVCTTAFLDVEPSLALTVQHIGSLTSYLVNGSEWHIEMGRM